MQSSTDEFREKGVLTVALERSPSSGAELTFCPDVPADSAVNLTNAAWLAFFSANEYAHLYYVGPTMAALGFSGPDDFDWPRCIVDLRVLRGFESRHADGMKAARRRGEGSLRDYLRPRVEDDWGACSRAWFGASGYDGARYPAPEFERYLIQTAHRGHNLQFFSGGEFVMGGKSFEVGSTQVMYARHRSLPIVVVSFRGTEADQWSDIKVDVKMWKTGLAEGWGSVHKGFHAAYGSVRELLTDKLAEVDGAEIGVWITGHSLGGALATLLAADLMRQMEAGRALALRGVYTFGSPRVGDNAFAARFERAAADAGVRVVRVRNGDDLVTAIPRVLEYKHVGRLLHVGENGVELVEGDREYSGLGSPGDHSIGGWDDKDRPVSGYYRRLLRGLEDGKGGELDRCEGAR